MKPCSAHTNNKKEATIQVASLLWSVVIHNDFDDDFR